MPRARQWRGYYLFLLGFVRHLDRDAGLFHGDSLMFLPGTQTLSLGLSQLPAPFPEPPNPIGCRRGRLPSDIWSDFFFWLAEFEYNGGSEAAGRWGRTGFFPSNKTPSTWWYRAPRTGGFYILNLLFFHLHIFQVLTFRKQALLKHRTLESKFHHTKKTWFMDSNYRSKEFYSRVHTAVHLSHRCEFIFSSEWASVNLHICFSSQSARRWGQMFPQMFSVSIRLTELPDEFQLLIFNSCCLQTGNKNKQTKAVVLHFNQTLFIQHRTNSWQTIGQSADRRFDHQNNIKEFNEIKSSKKKIKKIQNWIFIFRQTMQRINKSLKIKKHRNHRKVFFKINQKIDLKGKKSNALKPLFELRNGQI